MWLFLRGNTNIRGEFGSKLTEISPIQAMTSRVAVTYSGASESTAHSLTQNINAIIMFPSNAPRISALFPVVKRSPRTQNKFYI